MSDDDNVFKGEREGVLTLPENWDEMVKKYHEREDELLQKALERRNVQTVDELKNVAQRAMSDRAYRTASEHTTLKSHTVIYEPKSAEIESLRAQLNKEITDYAQAVMRQFPALRTPSERERRLKGRITIGAPEATTKHAPKQES